MHERRTNWYFIKSLITLYISQNMIDSTRFPNNIFLLAFKKFLQIKKIV